MRSHDPRLGAPGIVLTILHLTHREQRATVEDQQIVGDETGYCARFFGAVGMTNNRAFSTLPTSVIYCHNSHFVVDIDLSGIILRLILANFPSGGT